MFQFFKESLSSVKPRCLVEMGDYKIIEKEYSEFIIRIKTAADAAVRATHTYPLAEPHYRREEEAERKSVIDARKAAYADFEQLIKSYVDQGYSIGTFINTYPVLSQVVYKTVLPQAPFINNKLAVSEGSKGGSRTLRRHHRH